MNFLGFINRGIAASGSPALWQRRRRDCEAAAVQRTREQWLNALQVDQTRAWLELGERSPEVLNGLTAVLTLAALAKVYDDRHYESPHVRVIRGAISAADQCGRAGAVMTPAIANAFHSATSLAIEVVTTCSDAAIAHAAQYLNQLVNGEGNAANATVA